ncbi:hypothetical protein [Streptomyces sp. NPDC059786]|uniref:hypothetical protein n=1 Tax=Streptomyces sp. NPDC059786 TaxID=3346946 RepID=UPI003648AE09
MAKNAPEHDGDVLEELLAVQGDRERGGGLRVVEAYGLLQQLGAAVDELGTVQLRRQDAELVDRAGQHQDEQGRPGMRAETRPVQSGHERRHLVDRA